MTTTAKPASNGGTITRITPAEPRDGLAKLRRDETKALISLACEALSQTSGVANEMHKLIYGRDSEFRPERLDWLTQEALECWQTADHYLRMLGSVLAEYDPQSGSFLTGLVRSGEPAS